VAEGRGGLLNFQIVRKRPPRRVLPGTPPFITHKIFQILRGPIGGELYFLELPTAAVLVAVLMHN